MQSSTKYNFWQRGGSNLQIPERLVYDYLANVYKKYMRSQTLGKKYGSKILKLEVLITFHT